MQNYEMRAAAREAVVGKRVVVLCSDNDCMDRLVRELGSSEFGRSAQVQSTEGQSHINLPPGEITYLTQTRHLNGRKWQTAFIAYDTGPASPEFRAARNILPKCLSSST